MSITAHLLPAFPVFMTGLHCGKSKLDSEVRKALGPPGLRDRDD